MRRHRPNCPMRRRHASSAGGGTRIGVRGAAGLAACSGRIFGNWGCSKTHGPMGSALPGNTATGRPRRAPTRPGCRWAPRHRPHLAEELHWTTRPRTATTNPDGGPSGPSRRGPCRRRGGSSGPGWRSARSEPGSRAWADARPHWRKAAGARRGGAIAHRGRAQGEWLKTSSGHSLTLGRYGVVRILIVHAPTCPSPNMTLKCKSQTE